MELKTIEQFLEEKYGKVDEASGIHKLSRPILKDEIKSKYNYSILVGSEDNGLMASSKNDMIMIMIDGKAISQIAKSTLIKAVKNLDMF